MRKLDLIVIHCSATKPSQNIGVDEIRDWHIKGNGWSDIGYHNVIRREGVIEEGRPISVPGAHAKGYNDHSIGICLVGGLNDAGKPEANFTFRQYLELKFLVYSYKEKYNIQTVLGHRDLPDVSKDCPCFDVKEFFNLHC